MGGWGYEWGQDVLNHSEKILGARFCFVVSKIGQNRHKGSKRLSGGC